MSEINPNIVDVMVMGAGCVTRRVHPDPEREGFVGCGRCRASAQAQGRDFLPLGADSDVARQGTPSLSAIEGPGWVKLARGQWPRHVGD